MCWLPHYHLYSSNFVYSRSPTQWQYLEFAWDPTSGLQIYINNQQVATSGEPKARNKVHLGYILQPEMDRFYLGRGDGSDNDVKYANASLDEVEYWHLNRDDLIAFDYILRGKVLIYQYVSTYKVKRHFFRHGRRIAPKFCTHVRIETRLALS